MIYFCAFGLIAFINLLLKNKRICFLQKEKINAILGSFILSIPAGMRSVSVGIDTQGYYEFFCSVKRMTWGDIIQYYEGGYLFPIRGKMELGYLLLNKVISLITGNFQILLLIIAFIVVIGFAHFFRFYHCNMVEAFFWLLSSNLYFSSFNIMRQYISLVFAINAVCMLKNKRKFSAFICILISFFFHQSALIFLFFFVLYRWCKTARRLKIILATMALGVLSYTFLSEIIAPFLNKMGFRYYHLLTTFEEGSGAGGVILIWIIEACILIEIIRKQKNKDCKGDVFFGGISILLFLLGIRNKYFDRIAIFFLPFLIVTIIKYYESRKNVWAYLTKNGLYILLFVMLCKASFIGQFSFQFWFNSM